MPDEKSGLPAVSIIPITDPQAEAIKSLADFGSTVIKEGSDLTRYAGRILGTMPHDAVGLVIGDPLHFVRTAIAKSYDLLLDKIFKDRGVKNTQPVSPSLAIPLLRAAYDEDRPELQKLWAALIATAMDPTRSNRFRLRFIETLRQFDPLDALVLQTRYDIMGEPMPNALSVVAGRIERQMEEVELSVDNLVRLQCADLRHPTQTSFYVTTYGKELIRCCRT